MLGLGLLAIPSIVAALVLSFTGTFTPALDRRLQPFLMQTWFRLLAGLFGLVIEIEGRPLSGPAMIACNHRSWLDIVALGATLTGAFVSKAEIARWPLLGYFARRGGRTLFIKRGELRSFSALGGELPARLRRGERVIFFPEGTVSAAHELLRFKPRLFEAAVATACPVQPVALVYSGGDGAAFAPMMDGDVLGPHALRILRCQRTGVRLQFLAPLVVEGGDAKTLAEEAHARVAAALSAGGRKITGPAHAAAV